MITFLLFACILLGIITALDAGESWYEGIVFGLILSAFLGLLIGLFYLSFIYLP
jgi:hypothetical protein